MICFNVLTCHVHLRDFRTQLTSYTQSKNEAQNDKALNPLRPCLIINGYTIPNKDFMEGKVTYQLKSIIFRIALLCVLFKSEITEGDTDVCIVSIRIEEKFPGTGFNGNFLISRIYSTCMIIYTVSNACCSSFERQYYIFLDPISYRRSTISQKN